MAAREYKRHSDTDHECQLKFTSNIRMKGKWDLCDFDRCMFIGARRSDLYFRNS